MPGGDRTGPLGLGPMTGRRAGYCAGFPVPGYMNPGFGWGGFGLGRGGFPRGGGRGRGFGGGRGRWWRGGFYGYSAYGYPPYGGAYYPPYAPAYPPYGTTYPQPTPEEEKGLLQDELADLEEEIKAVKARMGELEKEGKKEKK